MGGMTASLHAGRLLQGNWSRRLEELRLLGRARVVAKGGPIERRRISTQMCEGMLILLCSRNGSGEEESRTEGERVDAVDKGFGEEKGHSTSERVSARWGDMQQWERIVSRTGPRTLRGLCSGDFDELTGK
mmetsp:Transcript_29504/g.60499  ORF Transcript_29504/g.60499 Transcript_29504/m.60499 type:complete len:131 (-) Transcript_29504:55-447(-)